MKKYLPIVGLAIITLVLSLSSYARVPSNEQESDDKITVRMTLPKNANDTRMPLPQIDYSAILTPVINGIENSTGSEDDSDTPFYVCCNLERYQVLCWRQKKKCNAD